MAELLVGFPIAWAVVALAVPSNRWRPLLLPVGGLAHLVVTALAVSQPELTGFYGWLILDPLGKIAELKYCAVDVRPAAAQAAAV